jgi:hypothetical protein
MPTNQSTTIMQDTMIPRPLDRRVGFFTTPVNVAEPHQVPVKHSVSLLDLQPASFKLGQRMVANRSQTGRKRVH